MAKMAKIIQSEETFMEATEAVEFLKKVGFSIRKENGEYFVTPKIEETLFENGEDLMEFACDVANTQTKFGVSVGTVMELIAGMAHDALERTEWSNDGKIAKYLEAGQHGQHGTKEAE